jgi:hypothetical protein
MTRARARKKSKVYLMSGISEFLKEGSKHLTGEIRRLFDNEEAHRNLRAVD